MSDSLIFAAIVATIVFLLFLAVLFNPEGESLSAQWKRSRWLLVGMLLIGAFWVIRAVVNLLLEG